MTPMGRSVTIDRIPTHGTPPLKMTAPFVHLHLHTDYSVVDSIIQVGQLVRRAADLGMPAIAVTDQSNLFCLVKFYEQAVAAGIKPICGAEVWLEGHGEEARPTRLVLLVENDTGYRNLVRLCSRAWLENQQRDRVLVARDWLADSTQGLIALSGAMDGEIGQALLEGKPGMAGALLKEMQRIFPDRFYIEVQRVGRPREDEYLRAAVQLAASQGCPVVASNDVRFFAAEDFEAHEARVCIHQRSVLNDPHRARGYTEQQYLRSMEEMTDLWSDLPEAVENTVHLAARCNFELELGNTSLPRFDIPDGMTEAEFFRKESERGLIARLESLFEPGSEEFEAERVRYFQRLEFELDIITSMDFAGYFLIVADFIRWAKDNGVPVGPGRGSGAGSIVAWALRITDLDPIEYDLLFERFLNPERVSMPDFDVDFCMEGRDRVIQYVTETYGRDSVSQIITFGTLGARAVIYDVARVQGKPRGLAEKIVKCIPNTVGMTLRQAFEEEDNLRELLREDEAAEIWEMALKLEGLTRQVGRHAGGVVIAPSALTDFVPLYSDSSSGVVTQFDKDDVEKVGLVKFDFLGLRTLTIIDWAVKAINAAAAEDVAPVDIEHIPLDDQDTFRLLQSAETTAVFQLESHGMKRLIRDLKPSCFEDIVALVALFRPGPLETGMADDFVQRKHGRQKVEYPHPDLEPVLDTTYGTILYQEQVMQIAQVLAGYTLGEADVLRRAMGKKKKEIMDEQRGIFTSRAIERGVDESIARPIFDQMQEFAKYCFNKSHSAAYALVAYQTAWLKAHYPAWFMAAVLTSEMHAKEKLVPLVDECRNMKLRVIAPDVNSGQFAFTVNDDGEIVYGLGAIDGVGRGPVGTLVEERERGGPFESLADLVQRVNLHAVNRKVFESLIRSGALDAFGEDRATLMASLPGSLKMAEQAANKRDAGMGDLFGGGSEEAVRSVRHTVGRVRPWPERRILEEEKKALGLYLSGHPIDFYRDELRHFVPTEISALRPSRETQYVAGVIHEMRVRRNRSGERWAALKLEDHGGRIDATVFARDYQLYETYLKEDALVVMAGVVNPDDYSGLSLRVNKVMDIGEARQMHARRLLLSLDSEGAEQGDPVERLRQILATASGACPVTVRFRRPGVDAEIDLDERWKVIPTDELLEELADAFGSTRVSLQYADAGR